MGENGSEVREVEKLNTQRERESCKIAMSQ
jgi:hypothetical protein